MLSRESFELTKPQFEMPRRTRPYQAESRIINNPVLLRLIGSKLSQGDSNSFNVTAIRRPSIIQHGSIKQGRYTSFAVSLLIPWHPICAPKIHRVQGRE